ncbi:UDP-N-acetylmuramoyl-tripeptide--D-alanyl-D-alanine ligase [Streptococcus mutans]|uniref:UDP-N-acetylmuramoyl-tripeptide--D-alanyl-D- alanine ligase n=1 Tax=Streptococcus mutans TaxID=1309 RepID=UPI0002B5F023|nr:UDP-N-acetylmuramoyl-tripeptide--D-alanyl-D-alanine ligase [Streptococcus mutans]EMB85938.1 putative D-Ala-D-Ala adding enzyme [Streptococcus mutans A9]MCB4930850.1 UDP-N-acetylmuramoyl-tripeptide--D-alanyl-D-alanine ligase [Streptococcus mutans]MCB5006495.1 UDP-N-acetylmuramoyl-tripeptide--D-alanyl-D-alanine ligase [Streptococcus mutans]MCB5029915.1 UDP-N-acetylmuramoyl-tripeptide--D-alanyl-D-alanine ligase [Streptococcus mutans]MCB5036941.1 UDP-N-acetylmuramoyl-tripeptide--D-alanyl-D-alan
MKLTLQEIASVVGAQNDVSLFEDLTINAIEFDSRQIKTGDLFLPLQGARDGHEFIDTAFANGAVATFSEKNITSDYPYILVVDCLKAFQDLAQYYLEKMRVDVIAITGSNGKTTTKDMIATILATTYKTYKTQGNYNNEIGLPYTVLHMPDDTEKIVLEMGQDHLGDIALLSNLTHPHIAVITLIGEAHLEFFGSREKIAEGKMQITQGMDGHGILIAPADKIISSFLPEKQKVIRFGADEDIFVTELEEHKNYLNFKTNFLDNEIKLPVTGKYNATNAMIASYVGKLLNISEEKIISALAQLNLTRNRTEWKKAANGADILSDVYNANPTAMKLILETFSSIPANNGGKKIAVLADMKELGDSELALHAAMIASLDPAVIDRIFLFGPLMQALADEVAQVYSVGKWYYFAQADQVDELTEQIQKVLGPNDQILLKGSNSMKLAQVVECLEG